MTSNVSAAVCTIAICASAHGAHIIGVTDLAQDRMGWFNYCAPTNGANLAYYYAQFYPGLAGAMTPADADNMINDMASRMGTSHQFGTTAMDLVMGLDGYLEDNWDAISGGTDWNTQYLDSAALGGAGLLTAVDSALAAGDGVILLIAWKGGLPVDPAYQFPDSYDGGTMMGDPIGHAVALTGTLLGPFPVVEINDPANNAGVHSFATENMPYDVTLNAFDWTLAPPMGGATATVYGAVTTSIPSPGALTMLGLGLVFVVRRHR